MRSAPVAIVAAALVVVAVGAVLFAAEPRLGVAALGIPAALVIAVSPLIGTALLVFGLPLEELGGLTPDGFLTLNKLLGVAVVGSWLLHALLQRRPIRVPLAAVPLAALVLWGATSALWAVEPGAAIHMTVTYVQLLAFYVLLVNVLDSPAALRAGLLAHVAGAAVLAVVGLYLVGNGVLQQGRAAIVIDSQMILEPNALAAALLLPSIIGVVGALDRGRPGIERLALAFAGLLFVTTITFTLSRGALVALLVVAVLVSVARRQPLLPVVAALLAVPGVLFVGDALWDRLAAGATLADRAAGRLDIWHVGWVVIRSHPLQGVGLGCFPIVYFDYMSQAADISWRHVVGVLGTLQKYPHSFYLGTIAELGIVGAVLLGVALVAHARHALATWRWLEHARHPAAGLVLAAAAGLVGLIVLGMAFDLGNRKYFWMALALAEIGRGRALGAGTGPVAAPVRRAA